MMWPDHIVKENWRRGKQKATSGNGRQEADTSYVSFAACCGLEAINHEGRDIA
jgi:hypothetical protein